MITMPADKVMSVLDFGTWALGNFKTTDEVKQALERGEVDIWLPHIESMWSLLAPVHFALYDRSGGAIVIESASTGSTHQPASMAPISF